MDILKSLLDPNLLGSILSDKSTWSKWIVFLKVLFGSPVVGEDFEFYKACTGRETTPAKQLKEAWVVAGRRSGKSFIAALVAAFLACFRDYSFYLAPGERAHILVIAADRNQAQVVFRYIQGFLKSSPLLAQLIEGERAESIDLSGRVTISVATCSYRSIRGFTAAAVICDEVAFWKSDDSVDPALEVIRAIRPSLATIPDSILLCISSPYSRSGPLWEAYRKYYGQEADVLVWQAPTLAMNPTINQSLIDQAITGDPEAAQAEWMAEFRSDLEAFLPIEAIEAVTVHSRYELPPMAGTYYRAFVDPSGGRGDAAALAISHRETDRVVLDLARRWRAPHDPSEVVKAMAEVLKGYRISRVTGDRYAGAWPEKEFLKHNIVYEASGKDKSAIYLELLPMVLSGRVELLDNKTLFSELRSLERRTRGSGRDQVDHPPKGHDDLANAVAGACVLVSEYAGGEISYRSIERRRFDRESGESIDREDIPFTRRREKQTAW